MQEVVELEVGSNRGRKSQKQKVTVLHAIANCCQPANPNNTHQVEDAFEIISISYMLKLVT